MRRRTLAENGKRPQILLSLLTPLWTSPFCLLDSFSFPQPLLEHILIIFVQGSE